MSHSHVYRKLCPGLDVVAGLNSLTRIYRLRWILLTTTESKLISFCGRAVYKGCAVTNVSTLMRKVCGELKLARNQEVNVIAIILSVYKTRTSKGNAETLWKPLNLIWQCICCTVAWVFIPHWFNKNFINGINL